MGGGDICEEQSQQIKDLDDKLSQLKEELMEKTKGKVFVKDQSLTTAENITQLNKTLEGKALTYLTDEKITFGENETIETIYRSILEILPKDDLISIKYNAINDLIMQKKKNNAPGDDIQRCIEELKFSNEKIKSLQT